MSRYIDADALLASYTGNILTAQVDYAEGIRDVMQDIKDAPSIDIVRCKECRYKDMDICPMYTLVKAGVRKPNDFCSYGERSGE